MTRITRSNEPIFEDEIDPYDHDGEISLNATLTLFSDPNDIHSHRIRLICSIKELDIGIESIDPENSNEDFLELNKTGQLPTLMDRDFCIFSDRILSEYLDERFPHPPLMPIEANQRAKIRLFCNEVEKEFYPIVESLERDKLSTEKRNKLKREIQNFITQLFNSFKNSGKHLSENGEMCLFDCCILPLLWRLEKLGIKLPDNSPGHVARRYMEYHFKQDYFAFSLSHIERKYPQDYVQIDEDLDEKFARKRALRDAEIEETRLSGFRIPINLDLGSPEKKSKRGRKKKIVTDGQDGALADGQLAKVESLEQAKFALGEDESLAAKNSKKPRNIKITRIEVKEEDLAEKPKKRGRRKKEVVVQEVVAEKPKKRGRRKKEVVPEVSVEKPKKRGRRKKENK